MLTFLQEYKNSLLVDIPKHGIGEGPVVVVVGQLLGPPTVVLLPTAANFPTGPRLSLQKKSANLGVSEVSRKNKKGGVIIPDDNIT